MPLDKGLRSLFVRPAHGARFPALDGLRALAAIWIIGLHTVSLSGSFWIADELDVHVFDKAAYSAIANSPLLRLLVKGDLAVDLFFVLSGFLIGSMLLREQQRMTGTDVLGFYRNRVLRLFPAYLATMALFALFGRGSASTAWSNLLYVNNFIPTYDQFMLHAWSLAVEAQFYLLFPLLLLLVKNPGRRFWIGLIVLGLAVRALVIVRNEVWAHTAASPVIDRDACAYFNDVLYDKFYTRYGALVCGVLAAQEYMTGAARRFFQRRIAPYACLVVSLVVTAIICSPPPVASGAGPGAIEVSIFLVLYQTLFAAAVAFVMLAVLVGWKPLQPLASFLSWRGFFPLAQLSYGAYLLHPLVIEQTYLLAPPSAASPALLLGYFAAFLLGAFALAIPLHLFVEAPGMRLRRPFAARQVAASGATS